MEEEVVEGEAEVVEEEVAVEEGVVKGEAEVVEAETVEASETTEPHHLCLCLGCYYGT